MNDLEITRLCAEAMELEIWWNDYLKINQYQRGIGNDVMYYDPLHDDAQAMGLVKKLSLSLCDNYEPGVWSVCGGNKTETSNVDLNRAICECVARMQAGKRDEGKAT